MKNKLFAIGLCLILSLIMVAPVVFAQNADLTTELEDVGSGIYGGTPTRELPEIIGSIINTVLGFLGVVVLVIILYAGFLYMTAGGSPDQTKKATSWIINAVIGLVIILSAYAISSFIIKQISFATQ